MAKKRLTYIDVVTEGAVYDGSTHLETVEGLIELSDELSGLGVSSKAFKITPEGGVAIDIVPNDCKFLDYDDVDSTGILAKCGIDHKVTWNVKDEEGVFRCGAYTSCTDKGVNLCRDRQRR